MVSRIVQFNTISSHGADAFGLMCIHYDQPEMDQPEPERDTGAGVARAGAAPGKVLDFQPTWSLHPYDLECVGRLGSTRRPIMDTEKTQPGNGQDNSPSEEKKPIIDEMTDLVAEAAGNIARTAVKAAAKTGRKVVSKRLPSPVKRAANTIAQAAKAPKKTARKAARKSKSPAKRAKTSARRKTAKTRTRTRVAEKKKAGRR